MDWKHIVALALDAGFGLGGAVLQPRLAAVSCRWFAYPWWTAVLVIVPLASFGAVLGVCAVFGVWGRAPLWAFLVGSLVGGYYLLMVKRARTVSW